MAPTLYRAMKEAPSVWGGEDMEAAMAGGADSSRTPVRPRIFRGPHATPAPGPRWKEGRCEFWLRQSWKDTLMTTSARRFFPFDRIETGL